MRLKEKPRIFGRGSGRAVGSARLLESLAHHEIRLLAQVRPETGVNAGPVGIRAQLEVVLQGVGRLRVRGRHNRSPVVCLRA